LLTAPQNYTAPNLKNPQPQYFNASVQAQQYGSGGSDQVSMGWVLILLLVFLMNIFVLIYFLFHRGLVTDFSEPPNLFALAVNSPPSHLFAGSCGGGPEGKQFMVNWFVNTEGDHLFMEPGQRGVPGAGAGTEARVNGHGHGHSHAHVHGQPHTHGPAPTKKEKLGFFSSVVGAMTGLVENLRARGLQSGNRDHTRRVPASDSEQDLELEQANTRTQRQYAMLAKRRSML
jgi:hypothetical protein